MAQVKISLGQVGELSAEALDDAVAAIGSSLALAAEELAGRAKRLQEAAAVLRQQLDADPQEVAALDQAVAETAALQVQVGILDTREPRRPRIAREEWLVFGRVLQRDGQPASGVLVGVNDPSGSLKDVPRDETDEFGDFGVAYRRDNFPDKPEPPLLHVLAENQRGEEVYRSATSVPFQKGRAEYVEITVREEPVKRGRTARKASEKAAAPKQPGRGRRARPGSRRP